MAQNDDFNSLKTITKYSGANPENCSEFESP